MEKSRADTKRLLNLMWREFGSSESRPLDYSLGSRHYRGHRRPIGSEGYESGQHLQPDGIACSRSRPNGAAPVLPASTNCSRCPNGKCKSRLGWWDWLATLAEIPWRLE